MRKHFAQRLRRALAPVRGGGRVRLHPLFLLLMAAALAAGLWQPAVVLFLLVALHELGHAAAAQHLGYTVEEVSLLPFGGVAKLGYGRMGFVPRHEALIAAAGPLVNLVMAGFASAMAAVGWWNEAFAETVIEINLWIAVFNLLPALPLDGGRVLRAARSRRVGYERATREAIAMAFALSAALLLFGTAALWAGYPHLGVLALGVFLLVSAWRERRQVQMDAVRFLDAKRRRIVAGAQPVRALAAPQTATVRDVVERFAPDRYHMVYVLDGDGAVRTILEEDELLEAVFEGRWLEPLERWLRP
jgi:stage IV sporulation protein FB